tara:strand:+ start:886 stop:1665 length:780 start_codon:yes stop_codon:yes gene_type:complete
MRNAIACLKFLAFIFLCLIVTPIQLVVLAFTKGPNAYIIPHLWHKAVCMIFRIKIRCTGKPERNDQVIFIGNHISYLDISVIASILQNASFVAKKDVEGWAVFGFLSKLQQTAFISRSKEDAAKEKLALDTMLYNGKNLIIFPEGTSTDGKEVLPFKSSLFAICFKENLKNIKLQPFTLQMISTNGQKISSQEDRDIYSWHINMDTPLEQHLWAFAKSKGAEISLVFHPAINAHDYSNRKTLAKTCHDAVSKELEKQAA